VKVAVIKYNAGNIRSVQNALARLSIDCEVTDDPDEIQQAARVIFPGVGEASTAMTYLRERRLDEVIRGLTQPVLGICLGMQLLSAKSDENMTQCLGVIPEQVRQFPSSQLKVPHIGWNSISNLRGPLFSGVNEGSFVYFVHGYYLEPSGSAVAETEYGLSVTAAVHHRNFMAVQFHPEKSGEVGERILRNFLKAE
jgi:glutamine amidotransferase